MEARDAVKVHVGSGEEVSDDGADQRKIQGQKADPDANAGSDYDAMPVEDGGEEVPPADPVGSRFSIPNSVFRPAGILVYPRCPTIRWRQSNTTCSRSFWRR